MGPGRTVKGRKWRGVHSTAKVVCSTRTSVPVSQGGGGQVGVTRHCARLFSGGHGLRVLGGDCRWSSEEGRTRRGVMPSTRKERTTKTGVSNFLVVEIKGARVSPKQEWLQSGRTPAVREGDLHASLVSSASQSTARAHTQWSTVGGQSRREPT